MAVSDTRKRALDALGVLLGQARHFAKVALDAGELGIDVNCQSVAIAIYASFVRWCSRRVTS
jgi:hypothetical protein